MGERRGAVCVVCVGTLGLAQDTVDTVEGRSLLLYCRVQEGAGAHHQGGRKGIGRVTPPSSLRRKPDGKLVYRGKNDPAKLRAILT